MFAKSIVSSSKFMRMPATCRLLYYDLGMAADDDGYCEWFPVVQMTGAKEQDLEVLAGGHFVEVFDRDVLVVLDWKENNYLRSDRYTPSKYQKIYPNLADGTPLVYQMDTQDRLGKERLINTGEVSVEERKKAATVLEKHLSKKQRPLRINVGWEKI